MSRPFKQLLIISFLAVSFASIIDQHFKAINSRDIKAVAATYTADAQVFSPNWDGAKTGQDSVTNIYSRYFKSTPDLTYKVVNMIKAGDAITVEYSFSGTLSNPEGGTPNYMKDKKYTLQGCAIFILKNNKIIKETNYFDQVAFLKQVGFFDQNH
jgi:steroid delta-isomerase-like uncharacterized protein